MLHCGCRIKPPRRSKSKGSLKENLELDLLTGQRNSVHSESDTANLPPHLRRYGLQSRSSREFSGPPLLLAESEEGCVEYKLRLSSCSEVRFQQLVTQLKWRLAEGGGQCFYFLGVEDNGHPRGLEEDELTSSLAVLESMAAEVSATVTLTRRPPGTEGRLCAVARIRQARSPLCTIDEVRVAVAGSAGTGKSTLVAVLTRGTDGQPLLDNGRGLARMSVLRHKHELQSGRTSCVSHQLLGYGSRGSVLNYARLSSFDPGELAHSAARILRLYDLGGHERFSKTSLHGITSTLPHYVMLCVTAGTRVPPSAADQLAVAVALGVPAFAIVTKADTAGEEGVASVATDVQALVLAARLHSRMLAFDGEWPHVAPDGDDPAAVEAAPVVESAEQAVALAGMFGTLPPDEMVVPIFKVSSVTGEGVPLLHAFLNALPTAAHGLRDADSPTHEPTRDKIEPTPASGARGRTHFQIDHVFEVAGVGTVLSGVVRYGRVAVGDVFLLGPSERGAFQKVRVTSIHQAKVEVDAVGAQHHATVAIETLDDAPEDTCSPTSSCENGVDIPVRGGESLPSDSECSCATTVALPRLGSASSLEGFELLSLHSEGPSRAESPFSSPPMRLKRGPGWQESSLIEESRGRSPLPPLPPWSSSPLPARRRKSVDSHPPHKSKSQPCLGDELEMLGRSWEFARELHAKPSRHSAAQSPRARKGTVLLNAEEDPEAAIFLTALVVIVGEHWFLTRKSHAGQRYTQAREETSGSDSDGESDACGSMGAGRPRQRGRGAAYTPFIHCGGVRQAAQVVDLHLIDDLKGNAPQMWSGEVHGACMAAVGVLSPTLVDGGTVTRLARVKFRFCHRPEWLLPKSRLVVRDPSGRVSGVGIVEGMDA